MGLLDMAGSALSAFRAIFGNRAITRNNKTVTPKSLIPVLDGPACVTIHPFDNENCVVQNFNDEEARAAVTIQIQKNKSIRFIDGFSKKSIPARTANSKSTVSLDLLIPARGRVWIRRVDFAVKNN
jgi:hypothetical protein